MKNALETVNIREFFSVCTQLVMHSGNIIRDFYKTHSNDLGAKIKDDDSPFTEADVKVQTIIIKSLLHFWPNLKIIGEEEEDFKGKIDFDYASLKTNFISDDIFQGLKPTEFNIKDAIVFVDPLDGTVDFLKGELSSVTTLIGVSLKNQANIGIVGRYFKQINNQPDKKDFEYYPVCFMANADHKKAFVVEYNKSTIPQPWSPSPSQTEFTVVTSKNHLTPFMTQWIEETLRPTKTLLIGGAGNKMIAVVEGIAHCYAHPGQGTKKWDTCAGEAILKALGGNAVNNKGEPIGYFAEKETWTNSDGYLGFLVPDDRYPKAGHISRSASKDQSNNKKPVSRSRSRSQEKVKRNQHDSVEVNGKARSKSPEKKH
jgi:3'(2'), 5'-bisphosphate nucleotidase